MTLRGGPAGQAQGRGDSDVAPRELTARAPGKVILLGEHAVVHGYPALVGTTLGLEVEVVACAGQGRLKLASGELVRLGDTSLVGQAWTALVDHLGLADQTKKIGQVDWEIRGNLPIAAGLGSSAALAVALARGLAALTGRQLTPNELQEAALAVERVVHGRPSGIDVAIIAHGGLGRFTRAAGLRPITLGGPLRVAIGHSGRQRDTAGRVARVSELLAAQPEATRAHFDAIGRLVDDAATALGRGDWDALGQAMNANAKHLAALDVATPEIDRLCELARAAGALGAKLTGGGGGGCVVALAPGREQAVCSAWRAAGFAAWVTELAAPGES